jgi:hypothetical protein
MLARLIVHRVSATDGESVSVCGAVIDGSGAAGIAGTTHRNVHFAVASPTV